MFKTLLAAFAFCACASLTLAGIYGPVLAPSSAYGVGPSTGYLGVPVPQSIPVGNYPTPTLADWQAALGSNAEVANLLQLALSLPPPSGPIVGTNYAVQNLGYGQRAAY